MRYIITLFFLITLNAVNAFAGYTGYLKTNYTKLASDSDTTVRKQSVSAGVSYGSDASFFGRSNKVKYPFYTADVIYNAKFGLFAYGSAWKVLGSRPDIDELDLGIGYSYKFSNAFKGAVSYTNFIFNGESQILKSASSNDIDLKNTYDWGILKSGVTLDYLFGKTDDFFTTISNSHYFESSFGIFDDKDYLTFTPSFNVILGTQNFVQKYSHDHDFFQDIDIAPGSIVAPPPNETAYRNANRDFNFLSYDIRIPLAYNRPHYTLEASYKYAIPVNVQGLLTTKNQSFYNLTFYYVFY